MDGVGRHACVARAKTCISQLLARCVMRGRGTWDGVGPHACVARDTCDQMTLTAQDKAGSAIRSAFRAIILFRAGSIVEANIISSVVR